MRKTREQRAMHDSRRYLKHHPPRRSDPLLWLPPPMVWMRAAERALTEYPALSRKRDRLMAERSYRVGRVGPSAERVLTSGPVAKIGKQLEAVDWARRHVARLKLPEKRKREILLRAVAYGLGFRGGGPDG